METYLVVIKDFKLRKCLSQFRLSSHSLDIEKGRHSKPKVPLERRICSFCKNNSVEDEEHFLLHCTHYKRKGYIFCVMFL